jgi:hypothetical protein
MMEYLSNVQTSRKELVNFINENIHNARKILTAQDFATLDSFWYLDSLRGLPRPEKSIEKAETLMNKLKKYEVKYEPSGFYKKIERLFELFDKTGKLKSIQGELAQRVYYMQSKHEIAYLENKISKTRNGL